MMLGGERPPLWRLYLQTRLPRTASSRVCRQSLVDQPSVSGVVAEGAAENGVLLEGLSGDALADDLREEPQRLVAMTLESLGTRREEGGSGRGGLRELVR